MLPTPPPARDYTYLVPATADTLAERRALSPLFVRTQRLLEPFSAVNTQFPVVDAPPYLIPVVRRAGTIFHYISGHIRARFTTFWQFEVWKVGGTSALASTGRIREGFFTLNGTFAVEADDQLYLRLLGQSAGEEGTLTIHTIEFRASASDGMTPEQW